MTGGVLEIEDLTVRFNGVTAVRDANLRLTPESVTGIIGPNGAGKTTLLSVLSGALRPTTGRVRLDGRDITSQSTHRVCRLGVCKTHQIPRPFGSLTVMENVELAETFGARRRLDLRSILEVTGLHDVSAARASSLRPSELRRLELARALATDPRVLLIDEVAAGMPTDEIPELVGRIRDIAARGVTLVLVEHVMDLLLQVSDRLVVMDGGLIVADGQPDEVIRLEHVMHAYFGASVHDPAVKP